CSRSSRNVRTSPIRFTASIWRLVEAARMPYRIIHTTRFEYPEPAYDSQNELRMRPWDRDCQRCVTFELSVNEPASTVEYEAFCGNRAHSVCVSGPHRSLEIVAKSIVEVDPPAIPS